MDKLLAQITELKKETEKLTPFNPEFEQKFWWKFRLEFNYNSNHLEGNTLTYGHTQILLKSGDVIGKYNMRELQEMKAHDLALKNVREAAEDKEFTLTQKFIKEINEIILVEPFYNDAITEDGRKTKKLITPGQYKSTPNSVLMANGEMFFYPSPKETPALMTDLVDWYEKESDEKKLHPVQIAALFHYKFVRIHPFDDSNGRTARLLMNYISLKNGYAPLVIESADKKNYLRALNEADAGNVDAFVDYVLSHSLKWQAIFLKAMKGEKIQEHDDFDKQVAILKKQNLKQFTKQRFEIIKVTELFNESILPLFRNIYEKIQKLDEFYNDKKVFFGLKSDIHPLAETEQLKSLFETHVLMRIQPSSELNLIYKHEELNITKENGVDYSNIVSVKFQNYTYEISMNNHVKLKEKSYAEFLTEDEIRDITSAIAQGEFNFITEKKGVV
jgi:Fic family protein